MAAQADGTPTVRYWTVLYCTVPSGHFPLSARLPSRRRHIRLPLTHPRPRCRGFPARPPKGHHTVPDSANTLSRPSSYLLPPAAPRRGGTEGLSIVDRTGGAPALYCRLLWMSRALCVLVPRCPSCLPLGSGRDWSIEM